MAGFKQGSLQIGKKDNGPIADQNQIVISIDTSNNLYTTDEFGIKRYLSAAGGMTLNISGTDLNLFTSGVNQYLSLNPTGITSGTYGGQNIIGSFVVDKNGRLLSATNISISAAGIGTVTSIGISTSSLSVQNTPITTSGNFIVNLSAIGSSGISTKTVYDNFGRIVSGGSLIESDIPFLTNYYPVSSTGNISGLSGSAQSQINFLSAYETTTRSSLGNYLPLTGGVLNGPLSGTSISASNISGTFFGNLSGTSNKANQLTNNLTFSISGDVSSIPVNFNGTQNVVISAYLPQNIISGTFTKPTFNNKGLFVSGTGLTSGDIPNLPYLATSSTVYGNISGLSGQAQNQINYLSASIKVINTLNSSAFLPLSGGILSGKLSGTNIGISGNISANSFIKNGGTSTQFLKADGSVDSNLYQPLNFNLTNLNGSTNGLNITSAASDSTYFADVKANDFVFRWNSPYTETVRLGVNDGTGNNYSSLWFTSGAAGSYYNFTANSFIKIGGNSSQFLMADGSISYSDSLSNKFLPLSGGTLTGNLNISGLLVANNNILVANSYGAIVNGTFSVSGRTTSDQFVATNNGNGTNYAVGDDLWIGDINQANTAQLKGQADGNKAYLKFGVSGPIVGYDGINFKITTDVFANTFIKNGGNSSQFLMADGSISYSDSLSNKFLPLSGGTLTGNLIFDDGTTSKGQIKTNYSSNAATFIGNWNSSYYYGFGSDNVLRSNILKFNGCTIEGTWTNIPVNIWTSGTIYSNSFVKNGGNSSQFLMADGSISTYSFLAGNYLPLSGGTLTGLFASQGGTAFEAYTQNGVFISSPTSYDTTYSTTPRIEFASYQYNDWEIDNYKGLLRFYNPGSVKMSLNSNGILTTTSVTATNISANTYNQTGNFYVNSYGAGGSPAIIDNSGNGTFYSLTVEPKYHPLDVYFRGCSHLAGYNRIGGARISYFDDGISSNSLILYSALGSGGITKAGLYFGGYSSCYIGNNADNVLHLNGDNGVKIDNYLNVNDYITYTTASENVSTGLFSDDYTYYKYTGGGSYIYTPTPTETKVIYITNLGAAPTTIYLRPNTGQTIFYYDVNGIRRFMTSSVSNGIVFGLITTIKLIGISSTQFFLFGNWVQAT